METSLFTFLIHLSFTRMLERYTIPSYNIVVKSKANFHERQNLILSKLFTSGNKTVCVQGQTHSSLAGSACAKVLVYSLDMQDVLGPFDLTPGQLLRVKTDDRAWGVYLEVSDQVNADVWIDEEL